jgi:hypothetical protein
MSKYQRLYCESCKLIWGKKSFSLVLNCTKCNKPLIKKKFNPWMKAAYGLGIVFGGCLTLLMPGFPVIWIGGFLWGIRLIINGISQWTDIIELDAYEPSEYLNNNDASNQKIEPDKYHTIFKKFIDVESLNEKYSRLQKKNINNLKALRVLERLYHEALNRIYASEEASKAKTEEKKENSSTNKKKTNELFKDVHNINELKQKYHRLAKLNHPDFGGKETAMKRLNELYEEAKQRIFRKNYQAI